jgi:hypothetical protein
MKVYRHRQEEEEPGNLMDSQFMTSLTTLREEDLSLHLDSTSLVSVRC